jgi:Uma2 family endonuclease
MTGVRAVDPRVSFAELCQWPDDGRRYELYDGEVIVVPAPFPRHQRVAINLEQVLREYEQTTGGMMLHSPIDIVFTEYDVIQPDIVFFLAERRHFVHMMEATRVPPDLAVEVLSRSTEARDRGRKKELFVRFGVPEYWIVDPVANTIELYVLEAGSYALTSVYTERDQVQSPTLPGLTFDARRVFEE